MVIGAVAESVAGGAVIILIIALIFIVAPIGIWTEVSRARKAADKAAKNQMEQLKKIENAIKLCANFLSRTA